MFKPDRIAVIMPFPSLKTDFYAFYKWRDQANLAELMLMRDRWIAYSSTLLEWGLLAITAIIIVGDYSLPAEVDNVSRQLNVDQAYRLTFTLLTTALCHDYFSMAERIQSRAQQLDDYQRVEHISPGFLRREFNMWSNTWNYR